MVRIDPWLALAATVYALNPVGWAVYVIYRAFQ